MAHNCFPYVLQSRLILDDSNVVIKMVANSNIQEDEYKRNRLNAKVGDTAVLMFEILLMEWPIGW